jgi:diguanylate cyclase (GGDEF)-like protein
MMACMAALFIVFAVVYVITLIMIKNIVAEHIGQNSPNIAMAITGLQYSLLVIYALIMAVCFVLLNRYFLNPVAKDTLTGAHQQHYDEPLMQRELESAVKNGAELTLLMFSLDHFKTIKDICGHSFSDTVMEAVSKMVMRYLRSSDRFFRFGDEVFGVLIPHVEIQLVLQFAEGIRKAVENTGIFNGDLKLTIKVTVSIGVAHLSGAGLSGRELVGNANKALGAAQKKCNTVLLFRPDTLSTEADTLTADEFSDLSAVTAPLH